MLWTGDRRPFGHTRQLRPVSERSKLSRRFSPPSAKPNWVPESSRSPAWLTFVRALRSSWRTFAMSLQRQGHLLPVRAASGAGGNIKTITTSECWPLERERISRSKLELRFIRMRDFGRHRRRRQIDDFTTPGGITGDAIMTARISASLCRHSLCVERTSSCKTHQINWRVAMKSRADEEKRHKSSNSLPASPSRARFPRPETATRKQTRQTATPMGDRAGANE